MVKKKKKKELKNECVLFFKAAASIAVPAPHSPHRSPRTPGQSF